MGLTTPPWSRPSPKRTTHIPFEWGGGVVQDGTVTIARERALTTKKWEVERWWLAREHFRARRESKWWRELVGTA
jgi:hypothetical protein